MHLRTPRGWGGQCGTQNIRDGLLPTKTSRWKSSPLGLFSEYGSQVSLISFVYVLSSCSCLVGFLRCWVVSVGSGPGAAGCQRWLVTWQYLVCGGCDVSWVYP